MRKTLVNKSRHPAVLDVEGNLREICMIVGNVFLIKDQTPYRYFRVSPANEALTERSPQEACLNNLLREALVVTEHPAQAEANYRRLLCGRELRSENQILHADGSPRRITFHANPIFASEGTGESLAPALGVNVKKHLGRIWFDTQMGSGTKVFISLPLNFALSSGCQ